MSRRSPILLVVFLSAIAILLLYLGIAGLLQGDFLLILLCLIPGSITLWLAIKNGRSNNSTPAAEADRVKRYTIGYLVLVALFTGGCSLLLLPAAIDFGALEINIAGFATAAVSIWFIIALKKR